MTEISTEDLQVLVDTVASLKADMAAMRDKAGERDKNIDAAVKRLARLEARSLEVTPATTSTVEPQPEMTPEQLQKAAEDAAVERIVAKLRGLRDGQGDL